MTKILITLAGLFFLAGCLQTRADIKSDPPNPKLQKAAAETTKFDEINKDFRDLYGRLETVENKLEQGKDNEKVKALETKIGQLESKLALLETTVTELHTKSKKEQAAAEEAAKEAAKNPMSEGNKLFDGKKWEDAILAYEEYRKKNPTGKDYAEATFKIGVSFQNLGMKGDAKVFYKEVVDKYPKSKEATQAKAKLKQL